MSAPILHGLFREGQITIVAGGFNTGKSPLLADWAFCIATGTPWCGHAVTQRPVAMLVHEGPEEDFEENWQRMAETKRVSAPPRPYMFDYYPAVFDPPGSPNARTLEHVLSQPIAGRKAWLREYLVKHPDTVLFIDPFEKFYDMDKNKATMILDIYNHMREIRRLAPRTAFVLSYNLRKKSRVARQQPNLLTDPHDWLEEISGSLTIVSRSDVRLGLDYVGEKEAGLRVLNGVVRGRQMEPLLLESIMTGVDALGEPVFGGFQVVPVERLAANGGAGFKTLLTEGMLAAWNTLPHSFSLEELEGTMSRASVYRFRSRCLQHKLLAEVQPGVFEKRILL